MTKSVAAESVATKGDRLIPHILSEAVLPIGWEGFGPMALAFGPIDPPPGHVVYCHNYPEDCEANESLFAEIPLTREMLRQLELVNLKVNLSVFPDSDENTYNMPEWWEYPYNNKGDCEDIALEKRFQLMERGWPKSALLLTYVRTFDPTLKQVVGHVVLTVSTEQGDLILDNLHFEVLPWHQSEHEFVSRQSPFNPAAWQRIIDGREPASQAVIVAER